MACRCAVALWAFFAAVPAAADDLGPQSTGGDFAAATTEEKADYAARIAKAAAGDADALSDKVLAATALLSCLQKTIGPTPPPALARERLPFIALLCMAKR